MARKNVIQFSVEVLDKASKQLNTLQAKFAKFGRAIADNARRIGLGIAAVGTAFVAFVNSTTKAFDSLSKFSDLTGASVETLSALQFAAERSGVAVQTLQVAIRGMTRNVSEAATGTGLAVDAFRELDVSARDLNKLEFDQQMLVLADALNKVESGTRKLVLANDIFGGRASEILKLFKGGAPAVAAYRKELENLGGVVTTQAGTISANYQDSLTNLSAAFDGLKVALVESGIVDAMTAFNNALARMIGLLPFTAKTGDQLRRTLAEQLDQLNKFVAGHKRMNYVIDVESTSTYKRLQAAIEKTKQKLIELNEQPPAPLPTVGGADPATAKTTEAKANPLQSFVDSFDTAEQQVQKKMQMFRDAILAGMIPNESDRQRIFDSINATFTDGIEEITVTAKKKFAKAADVFNPLEAAAESAAQGIQQAFADFFFDPFEDGLRGMLASFINVIRRMIAETLALQVMGSLGVKGIFAKILGVPGKAAGGIASGLTMVGERGRELVQLPRGSRVVNNSATEAMMRGGQPSFVTNIDARGADPGLISRLPQILEDRDRRLMIAVERYARTGIMPI